MKTLLIIWLTFRVTVTGTIYHAVEAQTDSTPFITASNRVINKDNPGGHRWIAVSRDLEALGYTFGTRVQDRMNKRWTMRIDFLVNQEIKGGKWDNVTLYIENEQHK